MRGRDKATVFSRTEQESMATLIASATVDISQGVGHALHWEDPERFAATLTRAIKAAALVRR